MWDLFLSGFNTLIIPVIKLNDSTSGKMRRISFIQSWMYLHLLLQIAMIDSIRARHFSGCFLSWEMSTHNKAFSGVRLTVVWNAQSYLHDWLMFVNWLPVTNHRCDPLFHPVDIRTRRKTSIRFSSTLYLVLVYVYIYLCATMGPPVGGVFLQLIKVTTIHKKHSPLALNYHWDIKNSPLARRPPTNNKQI